MIGICTKCYGLMPLTRHHIVPRSMGGSNEPSNIRMACRPCHDDLDREAGVRPERDPNWRAKRNKAESIRRKRKKFHDTDRCVKCGGSIPKKLQLGIMQSKEVTREKLCQRHAWERERELWHSVRESLARKKLAIQESNDEKITQMLQAARA